MRSVTYDDVDAFLNGLIMAAAQKENQPQRKELEDLIRANGGLLIGAKALAHYLKPRFTEDTDYLLDGKAFQKVRKWFESHKDVITYDDLKEAICCDALAIDIIDARHHPVLVEVIRRESVVPSPEALAAVKYCAIINPLRARRDQDAVDFRSLVMLANFGIDKCLSFFAGQAEPLQPEVRASIERIRRGDSTITI